MSCYDDRFSVDQNHLIISEKNLTSVENLPIPKSKQKLYDTNTLYLTNVNFSLHVVLNHQELNCMHFPALKV